MRGQCAYRGKQCTCPTKCNRLLAGSAPKPRKPERCSVVVQASGSLPRSCRGGLKRSCETHCDGLHELFYAHISERQPHHQFGCHELHDSYAAGWPLGPAYFFGENLILCFRFALFWTQKGEEAHRDSAVSRFGIYQMRFPNCVDLHIEK